MFTSSMFHFEVQGVTLGPIQNLSFRWPSGVSWICGDEGKGKTTLLRILAKNLQPTSGMVFTPNGDVFWIDLQNEVHDNTTVQECWETLRALYPNWQENLLQDLTEALDMNAHREKQLRMLSAGSRRKVTVIAALVSGAKVTLLDQPFVALDFGSIQVIKDYLQDAAKHPSRTWIVADYTKPEDLPMASMLNLG